MASVLCVAIWDQFASDHPQEDGRCLLLPGQLLSQLEPQNIELRIHDERISQQCGPVSSNNCVLYKNVQVCGCNVQKRVPGLQQALVQEVHRT